MRPVSRGSRGKEVLDIQTRLRGLGFEVGREGADGHYGPQTERAVRAFQQGRLLLADGVVGENTWGELVEAGYELGDRLLYLRMPSMRGDDVLELQRKLNSFGFDSGPEDGIFGALTEEALMEFQRNAGLNVDAIVGESTLDLLRRVHKAELSVNSRKIPDRMGGYVGRSALEGVKIALDPGHGDVDRGYVGVEGLLEKKVNLDLAQRLARQLAERGAEVLLVRESDRNLGFSERAEAANRWGSEINLALHHNANSSVRAQGAATYYFANGTYFSEAGKRLAGYVVKELVEGLGRTDLHTHGRNYSCLRELDGLSLMVEPGFVTHPSEGASLRRPEVLDQEATAILRGLERYLSRS